MAVALTYITSKQQKLNNILFSKNVFYIRKYENIVFIVVVVVASNLLRLSYQGPASCSVLVDENGGISDSLETNNSPNHTKSLENTGRSFSRGSKTRGARIKRSLEQQTQQQQQYRRPPSLLDGGGGGDVNANGDGRVMHDNTVNSFSSGKLYARTNNDNNGDDDINNHNKALPRQMYDALLTMMYGGETRMTTTTTRPRRAHKKRQAADLVVYRKDSAVDDDDLGGNEEMNFVPLNSEHRIRVNLTIAADGVAGIPLYEVSLSLPGAEKQMVAEKQPVAAALPMAGAECECFCPCLEQDEDYQTTENVVFATGSTATSVSSVSEGESSATSYDQTMPTSTERLWTETTEVSSCPPPVYLFCDQGKSPPVYNITLSTYYIIIQI